MYRKLIFSMLAAASCFAANAMVEHLLPMPKTLVTSDAAVLFTLDSPVMISDPTECELLTDFFTGHGCELAEQGRPVNVKIADFIDGIYDYSLAGYDCEAYTLSVKPGSIDITAMAPIGVIRAAQTLMQLAEGTDNAPYLECVEITDYPAFKLRGFMHDVGRSYISPDELCRQIRLMSEFKVNTFHWHLTDNTGWRLQIDAYPELTGEKGITRFPGKFYSKDDVRRVLACAKKYGVTVIPEVDMPGHSAPFVNAMGFDMQSVEGIAALKVILSEVAELFADAPYIHIGGDEIGFPDTYINEMLDYVHSLGKLAVIWNQYNRPSKKVNRRTIHTDMTTNWATSGTLTTGIPNIDMRYNYTNHFDVFADLVGIYKSSIFYVDRGNADVAGEISAAWNDTMTPSEEDIVRMNNVYANVIASATRAWIGGGERYIEEGGTAMPNRNSAEFAEFADWERRFLFHKANCMAETAHLIPYVKQTNVCWSVVDPMPNGGDPEKTFAAEEMLGKYDSFPNAIEADGNTYAVSKKYGAGHYLRHIWHPTVKGIFDNPANGQTAYAWTYIYSPEDQDAGALIEFYTYSRSGNEVAPPAGKWDRRGSRIWLNSEEIAAPEWNQPDAEILQDQTDRGLTNENFTAREPVAIHLKAGWNQVFMKLPHADNGGTKRDKWQFTFVVTDPKGLNALDGIVYSTNCDLSGVAAPVNDRKISVRPGNGCVTVIGTDDEAFVYSPDGTLIARGCGTIPVSATGIIIVRVGSTSHKLTIR